jgi:hypothetical protein
VILPEPPGPTPVPPAGLTGSAGEATPAQPVPPELPAPSPDSSGNPAERAFPSALPSSGRPELPGLSPDSPDVRPEEPASSADPLGESPAGSSVAPMPPGVPPVPSAAAGFFGPLLPKIIQYAALLAGPGIERGLLGPAEAERLWDRHLLNCAVVAELVPSPSSLVDLGSGPGLPGIVLALLLPEVSVTLLEPMARRADFLRECVTELDLANATVLRGRAEVRGGPVRGLLNKTEPPRRGVISYCVVWW